MFLNKNMCCDPLSELSRQDGSNEGSQHMFSLRNKKNYLRILELSSHGMLDYDSQNIVHPSQLLNFFSY